MAVAAVLIGGLALALWSNRQREAELRREEIPYLGGWFPEAGNKPGLVLKPGGSGESYSAEFQRGGVTGFIRPFRWRLSQRGLEFAEVDEEGNPGSWRYRPCKMDRKASTLEFAESPIFDVPTVLHRSYDQMQWQVFR